MLGLLGRKIGMTQIFDEEGIRTPVSILEVGPCSVLDKREEKTHDYTAIVLGFQEKTKSINRPMQGFFKKVGISPKKVIREFRLSSEELAQYNLGDTLGVGIFNEGEKIDVRAKTKGRGFQGVIKRHGFHRGPMSHGSRYHRRPGSMGASAFPSRVFKGKKLPGRMGGNFCSIQNLKIVRILPEENLLFVEGAVPGFQKAILEVKKSIKFKFKKTTNIDSKK